MREIVVFFDVILFATYFNLLKRYLPFLGDAPSIVIDRAYPFVVTVVKKGLYIFYQRIVGFQERNFRDHGASYA